MGLLSGFRAKLKSNKHKKSPDIVCVNYKINTSFDDAGSSHTYRTTAIWNNSPKSTEKNKTTIRSPTIKRTSTSSTTSEAGKKGVHNKNNFSPQVIQDKHNKIKRNSSTNKNVSTHTNTYNNSEDTNRIIRKEAEESPYTDTDYTHSNHSDHCQEADENIKSVLIFMTEDHDGRKLYDSDKNNNEYSEYTDTEDNNVVILSSHNNSSEETNSDGSIIKSLNETEEVLLRENTSGQTNETGKSVRFAEENSYHSITPTIIRAYYFEPTEDDENEYEVKHVDLNNLSLEGLEEREDDEEEEEEEEDKIDENDSNIRNITQHDTCSLHYYNGMAFSSQASNIFFGGEDFELDEKEEKSEENNSRASSLCA